MAVKTDCILMHCHDTTEHQEVGEERDRERERDSERDSERRMRRYCTWCRDVTKSDVEEDMFVSGGGVYTITIGEQSSNDCIITNCLLGPVPPHCVMELACQECAFSPTLWLVHEDVFE